MFFHAGYIEPERPRVTSFQPPNEESDFLRELLLDGDFLNSHHALNKSLQSSSNSITSIAAFPGNTATSNTSNSMKRGIEFAIPQISIDNSARVGVGVGIDIGLTSSTSSTTLSSSTPRVPVMSMSNCSSSFSNTIISPPRVFTQEFGRLHHPFFLDSTILDHQEVQEAKPLKSISSISCSLLPLGTSNSTVIKKSKAHSTSAERKQLRCSFPDCPNLRRSAGFCNRHSGKVCGIDGCNKAALSRGKCPEHGGGSRCKRDGCSKFAQTRGLCKSHGGGRQCSIEGCDKNAHQNRLCRSHGGGKRCDFYGCPKWAQRSGFCCAHTKVGSASSSTFSSGSFSRASFPTTTVSVMAGPTISPFSSSTGYM